MNIRAEQQAIVGGCWADAESFDVCCFQNWQCSLAGDSAATFVGCDWALLVQESLLWRTALGAGIPAWFVRDFTYFLDRLHGQA